MQDEMGRVHSRRSCLTGRFYSPSTCFNHPTWQGASHKGTHAQDKKQGASHTGTHAQDKKQGAIHTGTHAHDNKQGAIHTGTHAHDNKRGTSHNRSRCSLVLWPCAQGA
eukprot:1133646-Pelagomonas_calceolata.AAC.13